MRNALICKRGLKLDAVAASTVQSVLQRERKRRLRGTCRLCFLGRYPDETRDNDSEERYVRN
jgi:hypothetical protein